MGLVILKAELPFFDWFQNIQMSYNTNWMIMGDFNYIRYPHNRNTGIGDFNHKMEFNEAISILALFEIPLKVRNYTWSNMQDSPLLEKLDWVFTSECWSHNFPNTLVQPLSEPISDHTPYVVSVGTCIPKAQLFRFEFSWLEHQDFKEVVQNIWSQPIQEHDSAKIITAKFKRLRKGLKIWAKKLSNLSAIIEAANEVIGMWDMIEEFRDLTTIESNGGKLSRNTCSKSSLIKEFTGDKEPQ